MSRSEFRVLPEPYLSSQFVTWSRAENIKEWEQGSRRYFPLARYALYSGLQAFGIQAGDEVLVPAYICSAAVEAICACGAVPVFFRVARDCSLDWQDAERRISARTRAVLAVHYFGFAQDLRPARDLANRRELFLIEDCAHILRGSSGGNSLGSFGDFSIFSWRKFLPVFEGGELIINSDLPLLQNKIPGLSLLSELKALKHLLDGRGAGEGNYFSAALSRAAALFRPTRGASLDNDHQQHALSVSSCGGGSSFDPHLSQNSIARTSAWIFTHADLAAVAEKRRQNYQHLWEEFASIDGVCALFPVPSEQNCPLHFPALFPGTAAPHRALRQLGIPASAWDGVRPAAVLGQCFPDADFLYNNLVFLPIHQSLGSGDIAIIARAVREVCNRNGSRSASVPREEKRPAKMMRDARQEKKTESVGQKRVLLVAFHFPPLMGSSGILRSLKYCRYLPEHGWLPTVLTVHKRAYERSDDTQMREIPPQVKVIRAFGVDARKHLSWKGSYLRYSAVPDRWVSWCLGAVPAGLFETWKSKIDVILTTFPISTAVLVGYWLHSMTGIPWVADFRDSMTEDDYPRDPQTRRVVRWLEKKAVRHASRLIFTARSTLEMYVRRYPELSPEKCLVISNGYDEEDFANLAVADPRHDGPLCIHHSGLIYPEERNPVPFFTALARLKKENRIDSSLVCVDLRAAGNEGHYAEIIKQLEIEDLVHFLPPLPYREALEHSNRADILLLLQGASCDHQIPAKAYEYLRLRKPILALTSRTGDTAALLNECGGTTVVDIADQDEIYRELPRILRAVRAGAHPLPAVEVVSRYSRQNQARELASCLSSVIGSEPIAGVVSSETDLPQVPKSV